MGYGDFGLDVNKKSKDPDSIHREFWCLWCNGTVNQGMSLCFSNWVICHQCALTATEVENNHRWTENKCWICNTGGSIAYETSPDVNTKYHLCKSCIDMAKRVLKTKLIINNDPMAKTKTTTGKGLAALLEDPPKVNAPSLIFIDLSLITPSKLNPRKEFNEDQLNELTESIKKSGVIQPVLVRPMADAYELVCGERRYRASLLAELTQIPASVRTLTDEEAMECMITENLQRKDVHPLEEADAFHLMMEKMRYLVKDIAARMGKPESYIWRRIQLRKLNQDIKGLFRSEVLPIGHAEALSRLEYADQAVWYKDYKNNEGYMGVPTLKALNEWIKRNTHYDLAKATFDITASFLGYKTLKTIPCTSCYNNTAVSNSLFPDDPKEAICTYSACYRTKDEVAFQDKLKEALAANSILLFSYSSDGVLIKKYQKDGYTCLSEYNDFRELYPPNASNFSVNKKDYADQDDYLNALDVQKDKYQKAFDKWEAGNKTKTPGFMMNGSKRGHYIYFEETAKKAAAVGDINANKTKVEYETLKAKMIRGRELDDEKVMGAYVGHIRNDVKLTGVNFPDTFALSELETTALFCIAYQKGDYSYQRQLRQLLLPNSESMNGSEQEYKMFDAIHKASPEVRAFIARNAIFNTFSSVTPNNLNGGVMFGLSGEWEPEKYNALREQQNIIRERRESKQKLRLNELKVELKITD